MTEVAEDASLVRLEQTALTLDRDCLDEKNSALSPWVNKLCRHPLHVCVRRQALSSMLNFVEPKFFCGERRLGSELRGLLCKGEDQSLDTQHPKN